MASRSRVTSLTREGWARARQMSSVAKPARKSGLFQQRLGFLREEVGDEPGVPVRVGAGGPVGGEGGLGGGKGGAGFGGMVALVLGHGEDGGGGGGAALGGLRIGAHFRGPVRSGVPVAEAVFGEDVEELHPVLGVYGLRGRHKGGEG